MKILMIVRFPHDTFSAAVKDGSAGTKTDAIIKDMQPEAVYFTEMKGRRTAVMVVEMEKTSQIPALAEPWFLTFGADVEFHPTMTPQDLREGDLTKMGQKWG